MATARKTGRRKAASSKPAPRARRVAVAKAKSSPRAKAAAKAPAAAPRRAAKAASSSAPARSPAKPPVRTAASPRLVTTAPLPRTSREREKPRPAARAEAEARAAAEAPAAAGLTDEERIESAKYLPRRPQPRVFEEERFVFPQSYGVNRLRLLVKDPAWLFAHWDVDPKSLARLRADLGERASALSQLTLRVFEDKGGAESTFLLPQDARTWYVPTRSAGRVYRAEVGVILPSGEFRPLARSNGVVTPRGARSAQKAKRVVRYDRSRPLAQAGAIGPWGEDASDADEPWSPPLDAGAGPEEERPRASSPSGGKTVERGGASDRHRR